ncbi:alpha/beta fold hydrolase [Enterovirga rhinocerotis]|uniref:Haloacetate dehalogenase n=1 Tax=Enterovirga rhinocerotis TaxID=1339210 RepID=A0A4R7C5P2_9HYPH|nr:alpha/beta hydrolase [Enterovirga rhinocerotis]TDR93880.1 haloacetate dehalogenase [Enterovirga rhinocerotis]
MTRDLFPGFDSHWIDTEAGRIFARAGGEGPPLLLLHGFPQTHAAWHRIAPALARTHRVVCPDLRGYGWSSVPRDGEGHETYSKRAMGRDAVAVMEALGHVHFGIVGHDRGGRVAYRLALDEPGRIERLALLDIVPTLVAWERIEAGLQPAAHWDFLSRPAPLPEEEIGRDPLPYFEGLMRKWSGKGELDIFDPAALESYRQSCNEPNRIHAFCEDYRAGRTLDREQDARDLAAGRTIACPSFLVWSRGYLEKAGAEAPLESWRRTFAPRIDGASVDGGHFLAEERPDETLAALQRFFG